MSNPAVNCPVGLWTFIGSQHASDTVAGRWAACIHTGQQNLQLCDDFCLLGAWSLLVSSDNLRSHMVNDHCSSILSKLLMTSQSHFRASRHLPFYLERLCYFFYRSHVILQALTITLNSSVSIILLWGRPELQLHKHWEVCNWPSGTVMFYILFPISFLIIPNTVFFASMDSCFHRAIHTQGISLEKLQANHSITVYTKIR